MSMLRDLTLDEAKDLVSHVDAHLAARGILPYSVRDCEGYEHIALPDDEEPIRVLNNRRVCAYFNGVIVETDVPQVGRHEIEEHVPTYYDEFVLLRCGLFDFLSKYMRKCLRNWNWTKPEEWKAERTIWRSNREVHVNAAIRDEELLLRKKGWITKRRWEDVVSLVEDAQKEDHEPPVKKQRTE